MPHTETAWVEVNGVSLRYRRSGRGGPLLVLVHEMAGCIESWDELAPLLETHCRLLCYDQRGFGLSEKNPAITLETMVADLAALLDALHIDEPVSLAASGLGASICLAFAIRHPERTHRLVVSSPATGGVPATALGLMERWLQQVQNGELRAVTDAMFATTYPPALRAAPDRYRRHRLRWLGVDPECFVALNRMMLAFDLRPELARVRCPVLVLGCTLDPIRPPPRSAEIAAAMPAGRFAEAASGHYLPIQHPELFAAHLLEFVGSAKAT